MMLTSCFACLSGVIPGARSAGRGSIFPLYPEWTPFPALQAAGDDTGIRT